jgi:hypothetical protein
MRHAAGNVLADLAVQTARSGVAEKRQVLYGVADAHNRSRLPDHPDIPLLDAAPHLNAPPRTMHRTGRHTYPGRACVTPCKPIPASSDR